MAVVHLWRYGVKGLDRDEFESVKLDVGDGFPNDRRWALQYVDTPESKQLFQHDSEAELPAWMHKKNFLCAYTAGELLASFVSSYDDDTDTLSVWQHPSTDNTDTIQPLSDTNHMSNRRGNRNVVTTDAHQTSLFLRERLTDSVGRANVENLFSRVCGRPLKLQGMTSQPATGQYGENRPRHFGNTSKGLKESGDTRILHIVNTATVMAVNNAANITLYPTRFRPNIVIDGIAAWEEFGWVGGTVMIGTTTLKVLHRTVRCDATMVDARRGRKIDHDVPVLLRKHFPEHGEYLGVYAQVVSGGTIKRGDNVCYLGGGDPTLQTDIYNPPSTFVTVATIAELLAMVVFAIVLVVVGIIS